jgi:hypothetical protein
VIVLSIGTASWVWTMTTVLAALFTAALLAILTTHALISATSRDAGRPASTARLRRRLAVLTVPLLGCLVVVVVVRLAIILAERPGP